MPGCSTACAETIRPAEVIAYIEDQKTRRRMKRKQCAKASKLREIACFVPSWLSESYYALGHPLVVGVQRNQQHIYRYSNSE